MMNFLRKQMKWVMAIIVVAFLLSTFFMYEGRSTRRTPERNADGTMSDYEVAQINGRSLMRSELERRVRDHLSNYNSRNLESLDMPAIYQAVLDQAILESQLAKEVDESGIRVSDAEADMAMKNYADTYFPTRETFYQALANSGIKVEDYKRGLARQMAVDRLLSNAIGEINISEDKAVEFYDTMKNLIYSRPEGFMIHAANFNKKEGAEVLREKLVSGGSWDVIVSNDELASNDLINITREPVFLPSTALTTGAFSVLSSLDVGEISPVFEVTSSDFAVGLKTQRVEATVTPYNEVSSDIRTLLTQQEQRNRLTAYETSLRNKAQVTINDASLFARNTVTSPDETIPELEVEDIAEISSDAKTETESKEETAPAIVIEEVKDESESEKEEASSEIKADEAKADEPAEVKADEAKADEPAEVNAEEAKAEEPVKEEAKTEIPAEAKDEVKTDAPAEVKTDEAKANAPAEVKPDEAKTETPAEVKAEEAKSEEPAKDEVKSEAPAEVKAEETKTDESAPVQEEIKTEEKAVTEASSDVKGAAE
ncbi:MAG: SurA N-terminal domain-containing protein [Synergistaceae bacterium]|nr:SurA N-terminal domain-containing protein [Synergistaceae bacterium]MBQ3449811.1 SurA N-terminal domain-containing protein [Synergistaceae bacterium]MBQ9628673.1 SurA N-terminal domain-containing protein [Synergistaceae bacterium]MBR0250428.1 SurA N-terminal domain-containing protein [Synergistaceae bacterium]